MRYAFQHIQEKLQDTVNHRVRMDQMISCPDSSKPVPMKWNRLFQYSCELSNQGFCGVKRQQRDKLQYHKTSNIHTERNLTMPCHAALWACLCKPCVFNNKLLTDTNVRNSTEADTPRPRSQAEASVQKSPLKSRLQKPQRVKTAFPHIAYTGLESLAIGFRTLGYDVRVYKTNTKYFNQTV